MSARNRNINHALAIANAAHVKTSVCEAVANTLEGMGVNEFIPNASSAQQLAFRRLIDELRARVNTK